MAALGSGPSAPQSGGPKRLRSKRMAGAQVAPHTRRGGTFLGKLRVSPSPAPAAWDGWGLAWAATAATAGRRGCPSTRPARAPCGSIAPTGRRGAAMPCCHGSGQRGAVPAAAPAPVDATVGRWVGGGGLGGVKRHVFNFYIFVSRAESSCPADASRRINSAKLRNNRAAQIWTPAGPLGAAPTPQRSRGEGWVWSSAAPSR